MMRRLHIVQTMENPWDYDTFTQRCIQENLSTIPLTEFAQKVGMLFMGRFKYPELSDLDGYLKITDDGRDVEPKGFFPTKVTPCGGCGSEKITEGAGIK